MPARPRPLAMKASLLLRPVSRQAAFAPFAATGGNVLAPLPLDSAQLLSAAVSKTRPMQMAVGADTLKEIRLLEPLTRSGGRDARRAFSESEAQAGSHGLGR
jgi:hypothetical protein